MSHDAKSEIVRGALQQLLFSPKGGIEGLLLKVEGQMVQVAIEPSTAHAEALAAAVGKAIELTASPDRSPKTKNGAHPVYKLKVITKLGGKAQKLNRDRRPTSGVVATIHYAKHGEPNGVILESGEFIHTRPPAMKKLKLDVGSKVVAQGEMRMTVLGTPLIEARKVNRVTIQ